MSSTNTTASGRRPSEYVVSPRKRRHLVGHAADEHGHRAVLDAGRNHAREDAHHLVGRASVATSQSLDGLAEQEIAHAAADDPAALARFAQALADADRIAIDAGDEVGEW